MYEAIEHTEITEFDIDPTEVLSDEAAEEAWEWSNDHEDFRF